VLADDISANSLARALEVALSRGRRGDHVDTICSRQNISCQQGCRQMDALMIVASEICRP
jgi:hypothetical protein